MSDPDYSVIKSDAQGAVIFYGKGAEKIFGYTPSEVMGKSVAMFHEPETVAALVPRLLKTAAETGRFEEELNLVRKGGERFRAKLTVVPIKRGDEIVGYTGITDDLTRKGT